MMNKDEPKYQLTPKVRQSIERALQQVHDSQTIPGETFFGEIDQRFVRNDFELTPEQLEDIEIGRRQIAAGLTIPHEDVMKKFDALYPDDED